MFKISLKNGKFLQKKLDLKISDNHNWMENPPQGILGWFMWSLPNNICRKVAAFIIPCAIAVVLGLYYKTLNATKVIESKKLDIEIKQEENKIFSKLWDSNKDVEWRLILLKTWDNYLSIPDQIWHQCFNSKNLEIKRAVALSKAPKEIIRNLIGDANQRISSLAKLSLIEWRFADYQFDIDGVNEAFLNYFLLTKSQIDKLIMIDDRLIEYKNKISLAEKQTLTDEQINKLILIDDRIIGYKLKISLAEKQTLSGEQIDKLILIDDNMVLLCNQLSRWI